MKNRGGRGYTIVEEDVGDDPLGSLQDFPPEKRLLIAMVQRALVDYMCPEKGKPHLQYDAGAWLFSSAKSPFSLFWVCDVLSTHGGEHLKTRIQIMARKGTGGTGGTGKPRCVIVRVDK